MYEAPEVGINKVHRIFIAVVFPTPLGPKKPKISALPTSKEILPAAMTWPKCFDKFFTLITISLIIALENKNTTYCLERIPRRNFSFML